MADEQDLTVVAGAGGDGDVSPETLSAWKEELERVSADWGGIQTKRLEAESARFCQWAGQSEDGRKWRVNCEDDPGLVFDGQTDSRIRLVDQLVNYRKALKVIAAMRPSLRVLALGPDDSQKALRVGALLRWVVNRWGSRYVLEMSRLADFVEGDEPGAALCGVYWDRRMGLRYEELDVEGLVGKYLERVQASVTGDEIEAEQALAVAAAEADDLRAALSDDLRAEEAAAWIAYMYPTVRPERARKAARDLRQTGRARMPVPYVTVDEPILRAHRINDDAILPAMTRDFQDVPAYFTFEVLTAEALRARVLTHGWRKAWVEEVLERTDGQMRLGYYTLEGLDGARLDEPVAVDMDGYYQVFTAHYRASNADGVPGVYETVFHCDIEGTATGRRLMEYPHGGYPGVLFVREALSTRALESRGVGSVAGSDQAALKLGQDTAGNIAQFALPPVIGTLQNPDISPMGYNKISNRGRDDVRFMQPPSASGAVQLDKWSEGIQTRAGGYFGLPGAAPGAVTAALGEYDMALWCGFLRDIFRLVIQYCQYWMPAERLAAITDSDGRALIGSRDDISGEYDVEVSFDPRDMDMEFVDRKVSLYQALCNSLDSSQTIARDELVARIMASIDGPTAAATVRGLERANEREAKDEEMNFLKIAAGIPVEPQESGQDWALRLRVLNQISERDPATVRNLPPERQEAYLERIKHLEFMAQQKGENAQIGRVGVKGGA